MQPSSTSSRVSQSFVSPSASLTMQPDNFQWIHDNFRNRDPNQIPDKNVPGLSIGSNNPLQVLTEGDIVRTTNVLFGLFYLWTLNPCFSILSPT